MRSDNLIQKVLKASLICGIAFNGLNMLLYLFMQPVFEVLDPILWKRAEVAVIGGTEMTVKPFFGMIVFILFRFAAFFGLWVLISTMTDMQRFSTAGGVLLGAYALIVPIIYVVVNSFDLKYAALNGTASVAARTLYSRVLSVPGYIGTAADILLFMAFAMLWHKHSALEDRTDHTI